jgi:hypothetical protein
MENGANVFEMHADHIYRMACSTCNSQVLWIESIGSKDRHGAMTALRLMEGNTVEPLEVSILMPEELNNTLTVDWMIRMRCQEGHVILWIFRREIASLALQFMLLPDELAQMLDGL